MGEGEPKAALLFFFFFFYESCTLHLIIQSYSIANAFNLSLQVPPVRRRANQNGERPQVEQLDKSNGLARH